MGAWGPHALCTVTAAGVGAHRPCPHMARDCVENCRAGPGSRGVCHPCLQRLHFSKSHSCGLVPDGSCSSASQWALCPPQEAQLPLRTFPSLPWSAQMAAVLPLGHSPSHASSLAQKVCVQQWLGKGHFPLWGAGADCG